MDLATIDCNAFNSNTLNESLPQLDYSLNDTYKVVAGLLVFLLILPFVLFEFSCFPIGASSAILLGAVLMVAATVLSQSDFYDIIGEDGNMRTIFLLLGMMIISQYFEREHIFQNLINKVLKNNISFPSYLLRVTMLSFFVAALFTNDAACVILTPLILKHWCSQERSSVELETLLLSISTSANIGSVITIFGNPQMALIASTTEETVFLKSQLDLQRSVTYLGIPAVMGYLLNLAFLTVHSRLNATGCCKQQATVTEEIDGVVPSNKHEQGRSRIFFWLPPLFLVIMLVLLFVKTDEIRFDIGILPMAASALIIAADVALNKTNPSHLIMKVDWNVILMFFEIMANTRKVEYFTSKKGGKHFFIHTQQQTTVLRLLEVCPRWLLWQVYNSRTVCSESVPTQPFTGRSGRLLLLSGYRLRRRQYKSVKMSEFSDLTEVKHNWNIVECGVKLNPLTHSEKSCYRVGHRVRLISRS
ncbi:uncharacterized protein [Haliotis asinina]|uniref:uncharacterized protein isoform X2 n=1 Tax=Haliotis asinina TaxID=109174 RepID=UPI003531E835